MFPGNMAEPSVQLENEIKSIPPESPPPEKIVDLTAKTRKKFNWKNFFLWFFVMEHVVLFILLLFPVIFIVRTFATTDFIALNEKASKFTPEDENKVSQRYFEKYENYIVDFVRPENTQPVLNITLEENDINTFVSTLKLDHIKKIYIEPDDDNFVNFWIKPDIIPYPVSARAKVTYNYEGEVFNVDIINWAIGPLSFPADLLNFIEESINENLWHGTNDILSKNSIHLNKVETEKGKLNIEVQIDDKVKFTENILQSSNDSN